MSGVSPPLAHALLDSDDRALIAAGPDGAIVEWNAAAQQLTGWERAQAVGRPLRELLPAAPAPVGEAPWSGPLDLATANGGAVPVHARIAPLRGPAGEPLGTVARLERLGPAASVHGPAEQPDEVGHRERAYLEAAPIGVFVADLDGRYVDVNPAACRLTGYTRAQLLTMRVFDLGGAPRAAETSASWGSTLAAGGIDTELHIQGADGRERVLDLHAVRLGDRIVGFATDVTEAREAREALADREAWFRTLFDLVGDGVLAVDRHSGECLAANPGMCALLGYPEPELRRLTIRDLHPEQGMAMARGDFSAAQDGASHLRQDLPLRRADGALRYADVAFRAATLGGRDTMVGVFRDVTGRREAQARLARADRLAAMGVVAAGVAHEVNNPLTWLMGHLDALAGALDAAGHGAPLDHAAAVADVAASREGVRRITEIVANLAAFARGEQGERRSVDPRAPVRLAVAMAGPSLRGRAAVHVDLAELPPVLAQEGQLVQVFLNLLLNAAQAIDPESPDPQEVRVRTWAEGDRVCVEIADTGVGIPPEHLPHLFEPFFTTKEGGSGLGLPITRAIIEEHGGTLSVDSTPGRGTRFTIRLPVAAAPAPTLATTPPSDPAPRARRGRILIVEDKPAIRRLLLRLLREHEVVEAEDGAAAQAVLADDDAFDLILCDGHMPQVTGPELLAWVRERRPHLTHRFVFLTGGAIPEAPHALRELPTEALAKPIDRNALAALLAARLGAPT
jgi:PAS domain S-box-containing protein